MAGLSFLCSLSLMPATSQPYLPLSTFRRTDGRMRCHCEMEESEVTYSVQDQQLNRRQVLRGFTTVVGLEIAAGSRLLIKTAIAADLIQRRQRSEFLGSIKDTLSKTIKENMELIPSILTLALNDAATYDMATKSGGANGSIRLSPEISRPENTGLSSALDLLAKAKEKIDFFSKGGPVSYADLIQLAAQSAVKKTFLDSAIRKCGGNEEKGSLLYSAYGSNGQWGLFDREFGRTDSQDPDPEGRIPQWNKASVNEMKDKFLALGLGPRQLAVMSAFLGPDQLATETRLASDPEVRPWVEKYQRSRETVSQTDYEWGLFDREFGRTDSQDPDPEGRIPQWNKASVHEMKDKFLALGLGPRQLAVMSAFLGPDQLATETRLASDPEVRPWVEKYQRSRETVSQTDYEVDLITTLTKLSSMGQKINYEAYTYPVQKIELNKLKL